MILMLTLIWCRLVVFLHFKTSGIFSFDDDGSERSRFYYAVNDRLWPQAGIRLLSFTGLTRRKAKSTLYIQSKKARTLSLISSFRLTLSLNHRPWPNVAINAMQNERIYDSQDN